MLLDKQTALDRMDDDDELYHEICGIFRQDAPQIMNKLSEAFNCGEIPVAIRHAHSLKSAAANIGANDLSETARLTENAFRNGELKSIHTLLSEINQHILRVLEVIE